KVGGEEIISQEELASKIDILFTSLPHPNNLLHLLVEKQLIEKMQKGTILIDVSTIDPNTAVKIQKETERHNVEFIACPLGKGPSEAQKGETPLFVGGNQTTFNKIEGILKQIGNPFYLGEVEQSTAFKLISNMIGMTNLLMLAEGIELARKMGIDLMQFKSLLHDTGGDSAQLNLRAPLILNDNYDPMFSIDLALKDVNLGVEMANLYNEKAKLSEITLKHLKEASKKGYGEEDCAAIAKTI